MMTELRVRDIIAAARRLKASDVHLLAGSNIRFRVDGRLCALDDESVTASELEQILRYLLNAAARRRLRARGVADAALQITSLGRIRVHAYRAHGGFALTIRLFAQAVPQAAALDIPSAFLQRLLTCRGLIVFAGPTGSGKTTALAASIEYINQRCDYHILTIEDPIEYLFTPHRCHFTQREIGRDVRSFDTGIYAALRSDPDVLVIGELRDAATIAAALRAAETGHLVLATLHSDGAAGAIDRMVDAFGLHTQVVRAQLAGVLEAVLGLQLVRRRNGGRRFVTETLFGTEAVRALIRDGRTHQLPNAISTGRAVGMHSFAARRADLLAQGEILA